MIAHFTNAVPDGCVCGLCEAVRSATAQARIARLEEATAIAIRTIQRKSTDEQKSVRRARI